MRVGCAYTVCVSVGISTNEVVRVCCGRTTRCVSGVFNCAPSFVPNLDNATSTGECWSGLLLIGISPSRRRALGGWRRATQHMPTYTRTL